MDQTNSHLQFACLDGVKFDRIVVRDVNALKQRTNLAWRTERKDGKSQELANLGAFTLVVRQRTEGDQWLTVRGSVNKQVNRHNADEVDCVEAAKALRGLFDRLNVDPNNARLSSYEVAVNIATSNAPDDHTHAVAKVGRLHFDPWTRPNASGATATASAAAYAVKLYTKSVEGHTSRLRLELRGQGLRMAKLLKLPQSGLQLRTAADLINALTYHSDKLTAAFNAAVWRRAKAIRYAGPTAADLKADLMTSAAHLKPTTTTPHFFAEAPKATLYTPKPSKESKLYKLINLNNMTNEELDKLIKLAEEQKEFLSQIEQQKQNVMTEKTRQEIIQISAQIEKLDIDLNKRKQKAKELIRKNKPIHWIDYCLVKFEEAGANTLANHLEKVHLEQKLKSLN